jgi:hypothetical protein
VLVDIAKLVNRRSLESLVEGYSLVCLVSRRSLANIGVVVKCWRQLNRLNVAHDVDEAYEANEADKVTFSRKSPCFVKPCVCLRLELGPADPR